MEQDASIDRERAPTARERRAAQTRREVLDAARAVFGEEGYAGASMSGIAARAGVAVQTVYSSVGSKAQLLVALVDHIRDEAQVPETDRALVEMHDPIQMVRIGSRMPADVLRLGADVFRLIRDVAPLEPEVDEVWQRVTGIIRAGVEAAVGRLDELGALRDGMTVTSATDLIVSSAGLDAALSLLNLGWSEEQIGDTFERLTMTLIISDDFHPAC